MLYIDNALSMRALQEMMEADSEHVSCFLPPDIELLFNGAAARGVGRLQTDGNLVRLGCVLDKQSTMIVNGFISSDISAVLLFRSL